jgi:hypothetical protein
VQRDDQVDERVLSGRCEAPLLDRQPPLPRDLPDLVCVVLAVPAVVERDAVQEALARQANGRERVAPRVGDRRGEPRVLGLWEDDLPTSRTEPVRE